MHVPEIRLPFCNGRDPRSLAMHRLRWPSIRLSRPRLEGELGVVYSVLSVLKWAREEGNTLAFEDDCIIFDDFVSRLNELSDNYPSDADFISLALPHEQRSFYDSHVNYNTWHGAIELRKYEHDELNPNDIDHPLLAKTYNTYNNVCMIWTPQGAFKLIKLLERDGIWEQIDDMTMRYARWGDLNGYCLKPDIDIATIVAGEPTLVHEGKWVTE